MNLLEQWQKHRQAQRRLTDVSRSFDLPRAVRTTLMMLGACGLLAFIVHAILAAIDGVAPFDVRQITSITTLIIVAGLAGSIAYSGFFVFARLQCSLLELSLLVALTGALEGVLMTTPGMQQIPEIMVIIGVSIPALLLWSLADSLMEICILGITSPLHRSLIVLCEWFSILSFAAALSGFFLWAGGATPIVSRAMSQNGLWLLLGGVAGCVPGHILGSKSRKKARELLKQELAPVADASTNSPPA
ncbi:MAG TPA: hypothetical protein VEK08_05240 [Planctomycetota bacterium]|nr:hypothetical protein [Planctomycetota bacterium]